MYVCMFLFAGEKNTKYQGRQECYTILTRSGVGNHLLGKQQTQETKFELTC